MQLILKKKNMQTSDRTFNIDEGSTITENYNETLDSAVIRVSHISSPIDIEPFDKAILHDEKGRLSDRYMCVDTYTETMESLDPVLYTYEISLFSETKELENIALPNLSITQRPDGTHRSVFAYLVIYLNLYNPQLRTETGWKNKYKFDSDRILSSSKFSIDCPEMQWNNPTLREVLTDLMMVVDCIPVLRNDTIDYIDLTETKNAIDKTKVNYIQRSQSSEDYVSELKMDMQNVMQTQVDNVKQTCTRIEYTTFTTDGFVITSDNYYLKTQFPILKIKHLWMIFQAGCSRAGVDAKRMFRIDLRNVNGYSFVYEKTEYDTLNVDRITEMYNYSLAEATSFSNYCVYFTRGDNKILGFSEEQKATDLSDTLKTNTLEQLTKYLPANEKCPDMAGNRWTSTFRSGPFDGNSYFSVFFEIEYETTTDSIFTAGKYLAPAHQRVIIDNQTNSYVDAYNQGFMEYQKVNRLGNHQLHINARFADSYNLIKIGDYYEDNIVYQTQYQIYNDHIEVNAIATKNYILKDYFTGVKARIRSWKIADGSEALTRHELDKYYLEFSFSQKAEKINLLYDMSYYFLTPIYTGNIFPITKVAVNVDNSRPSSSTYYCLDLIGRVIGNSVVYNFGFDDNFQAGKRVSSEVDSSKILNSDLDPNNLVTPYVTFRITTSWTNDYGGILLEPLRYVNNNGEFSYLTYYFSYKEISWVHANLSNDEEKSLMLLGCERPIVDIGEIYPDITLKKEKYVYKDNREIIKVSTQFEFCSDTYNIAFTKKFLELQQCIRNSNEMYYLNNTHHEEEASLDTSGGNFMTSITVDENIDRITNLGQRIEYSGAGITITLSNIYKTAISDTETKIDAYYTVSGDLQNLESFQGYISYNITFRQLVLRLRQGDISKFNFKNMSISNTTVIGMNADIDVVRVNNQIAYIDLLNVTDTNHAFYITYLDSNNEEQLLIGWTGHSRVYLNVLLSRDYNIYDNNGNIIGSI